MSISGEPLVGLSFDAWAAMIRRQLVEQGANVAEARRAMMAMGGPLLHRAYQDGVSSDEVVREIASKMQGDR